MRWRNKILARRSRRIPPSLDFEKTMEACEIYDHTSIHFFKEKSKEEKYFYLSSLKVSKIAPGGNASRAKKREKSINKAFISRGEKLVNGKKALKNNFSSFPQPRSEFNQRFSYLSIYPPLLSASWKTNYGDVRCNRNTVCNDRFYSNRTESELILMNRTGSERERERDIVQL